MYRYQKLTHICVFIILVMITFRYHHDPILNDEQTLFHYVEEVSKTEDRLYNEILQKSADYAESPQNAIIDKVWKKIPGRNGIKVDIDKSYDQMQKKGKFDESLLVYRQIPPEISLEDLPASPIYRGHPEKEMVTFLINVSWGTEYIPHILEVLKEKQVKATFFIEGKWAKENAEYVKMIADEDHIIGNHAYDHPDMARLSSQEITEQIEHTNAIIKSIIDEEPKWFAPPSGSYNNEVVKIADDLDMETIMWTVDTIDWKNPSVSVMIDRVMNHIHPGATILMHPTASVTRGLDELIDRIQQQGFRTGSIENLLSEKR
ncbi:MAG TPA: polysaccharide deacetylase family protein [Bacillota bacterium]|nr:polysaccharide deacetylase family protein [Bacillota bacterium]